MVACRWRAGIPAPTRSDRSISIARATCPVGVRLSEARRSAFAGGRTSRRDIRTSNSLPSNQSSGALCAGVLRIACHRRPGQQARQLRVHVGFDDVDSTSLTMRGFGRSKVAGASATTAAVSRSRSIGVQGRLRLTTPRHSCSFEGPPFPPL